MEGSPLKLYLSTSLQEIREKKSVEFSLSFCSLSRNPALLPDDFYDQVHLQKLSLSSCEIIEFPYKLLKLTNLTSLFLPGNQITSFPSDCSGFSKLRELNLSSNQITQLPDELFLYCSLIEVLYLGGNPISSIPKTISNTKMSLSTLKLSNCNFTEFPLHLLSLYSLTDLEITDNKIQSFPGQENFIMGKLISLNLRKNQIVKFPHEGNVGNVGSVGIGSKFPSLTKLDLSNNLISYLDPDISSILSLQHLLLGKNKITSLLPLVGLKDNLITLEAFENRISNNDIESIPSSFTKLTSLEAFYLDGNIINSTNLPLHIKIIKFGEFEEPDEILPRLYLGPAHVARNKHLLKQMKISHVLTVADIEPSHAEIDDAQFEDLKAHFEKCHNFIREALSSGTGILVHCAAGISRSPTIVISFVMVEKRMTFKQAYKFVKEKRPIICPNVGFQNQLQKFEGELGKKCILQ